MIQIEGLTKRFGKMEALKGITFEVEKGSVFGFVGPNGAGKSTTMSILATLMAPTSGKAYVGGYDVTKDPKKIRKQIGYMPDFFGVYDNLKAEEYLNFYASTYGISQAERMKIIPQLLELVNLSHKKDSYVDTLSRGMKQRLGLARSLVHNPEVLLLDEPASGLDPRARIELREILKELRSMGKTIIISSHILPELAELSDVIGIIEEGQMVTIGNVDQIYRQLQGHKQLKIAVLDREHELIQHLKAKSYIQGVYQENGYILADYLGQDEEQIKLLQELVQANFPILTFSEVEGNLEQIFLEITRGVGS